MFIRKKNFFHFNCNIFYTLWKFWWEPKSKHLNNVLKKCENFMSTCWNKIKKNLGVKKILYLQFSVAFQCCVVFCNDVKIFISPFIPFFLQNVNFFVCLFSIWTCAFETWNHFFSSWLWIFMINFAYYYTLFTKSTLHSKNCGQKFLAKS